MAHYLVVAHQTVTSPELLKQVRVFREQEEDAEFVLLVPATLVRHLLFRRGDEHDAEATARKLAERGRRLFAKKGLPLHDAKVGAPDPAVAIDREVMADSGYTGFVISTLPAEKSRWRPMDLPYGPARSTSSPFTTSSQRRSSRWPTCRSHFRADRGPPPPDSAISVQRQLRGLPRILGAVEIGAWCLYPLSLQRGIISPAHRRAAAVAVGDGRSRFRPLVRNCASRRSVWLEPFRHDGRNRRQVMDNQNARDRADALLRAWNGRNYGEVAGQLVPDIVVVDHTRHRTSTGPDGYVDRYRRFLEAFPGYAGRDHIDARGGKPARP